MQGQSSGAPQRPMLTTVARRLEVVLGEGTPADGKDVPGVILAPVVEGPPPAVEHDEDLVAPHLSDGGGADQVRVLLVHCLQLHARLKAVLGRPGRLLRVIRHR